MKNAPLQRGAQWKEQSPMSTTDVTRMSHRSDPDTSHDAAERASRGTKKAALYDAVVEILASRPRTPKEVHGQYVVSRKVLGWPTADLQDIRRRMTELEHDFNRIESVGRRNGERVMALVPVWRKDA